MALFFCAHIRVGKEKPAIHGRTFDEVLAIQASKAKPAIHGRTPQKEHAPMGYAD
jgi:hypothetical protein